MSSVTVKILGEDYTIRSKDDPAYVQKVAAYLDAKMKEIAAGGAVMSPTKTAILAALNITDEFFQLREACQADGESVDRVVSELIKVLDQGLGQ